MDSTNPTPSLPSTCLSPAAAASRTRRQQGLFFGGAAFVVFSAMITRRSLARRYKPIVTPLQNSTPLSKGAPTSAQAPGYSSASNATGPASGAAAEAANAEAPMDLNSSGPLLAVEALTVATLNVVSWAIMTTGGLLWAFDIGSMDDMRRKIRGGLGVDGTGRTEQEAEEEMEEWLATVLTRKEEKRRAGQTVPVDERGRERGL